MVTWNLLDVLPGFLDNTTLMNFMNNAGRQSLETYLYHEYSVISVLCMCMMITLGGFLRLARRNENFRVPFHIHRSSDADVDGMR